MPGPPGAKRGAIRHEAPWRRWPTDPHRIPSSLYVDSVTTFTETLLVLTSAFAAALPARRKVRSRYGVIPRTRSLAMPDSSCARAFPRCLPPPCARMARSRLPAGEGAGRRRLGCPRAAHRWLQRHGLQMMKIQEEDFDRAAYRSALSANAGPGDAAEIERLKRDPEVKGSIGPPSLPSSTGADGVFRGSRTGSRRAVCRRR
jgi:hypothetical protein